jgi:toxin ParE1/3/4
MNPYNVQITDRALADMQEIYDYIAVTLLAPETAMGQYNRIADAIESLDHVPGRCRLFECEPERSLGIRLLPVDNYAVIYTVDESNVTILRVLYSASDVITRLRDGE